MTARQRLRILLVGLGTSVVPLDTAVNIAFPAITGSFGLPIEMIQWVVICYVLTYSSLMLAFGRAGDIWRHGPMFRIGLLWSGGCFSAWRHCLELRLAPVLPLSARHRSLIDRQLCASAGHWAVSRTQAQPGRRSVYGDVRDRLRRGTADWRRAGSNLGLAGGILV